jgi:hypothetical protein
MDRKAQAMSEFLITYGWAILVVLIMIGALAGLSQVGVIKSDHVVPERCMMRVGLACIDHKVSPDKAEVRFINGLGKDIQIINISIGDNCSESFNKQFNKGETITFQLFNCNNGKTRTRFDGDIDIFYRDIGRTNTKQTGGDLVSRVY